LDTTNLELPFETTTTVSFFSIQLEMVTDIYPTYKGGHSKSVLREPGRPRMMSFDPSTQVLYRWSVGIYYHLLLLKAN
jgi:hypothetical protein